LAKIISNSKVSQNINFVFPFFARQIKVANNVTAHNRRVLPTFFKLLNFPKKTIKLTYLSSLSVMISQVQVLSYLVQPFCPFILQFESESNLGALC